MIILNEAQPIVFKEIEKMNDYLKENVSVKSHVFVHGTFNTDLKKLKKGEIKYATDVDCELWNQFINNKKDLFENFYYIYEYLLKSNKFYFVSLLAGEDDRFVFDFYVKKTGEIVGYDAKKIRQMFQKLYKDKVITKDELEELLEYVIDKPSLISFEKFKHVLEKFKNIEWSLEEIQKKEKTYRKKKFKLYELFMKSIFLSSFILEFEKGKYILFDLAYRVFELPKKYEDIKLSSNQEVYDIIIEYGKTYGEYARTTNIFLYEGIFKNYVQEKYLKMLKRLRSLLTYSKYHEMNTVNNSNKKLREPVNNKFISKIRYQIGQVTNSLEYSCLNQLKNRVDIILVFLEHGYKDDDEIIRLILELLKDSVYSCKYSNKYVVELHNLLNDSLEQNRSININRNGTNRQNKKKIDNALKNYSNKTLNRSKISLGKNKEKIEEALKNYKHEMFQYLNDKTLPHLIKFFNELKELLPFNLVLPLPKNNA